eukprot:Ihof_evm1s351 gene=Ihof_evmTU1s351
MGSPPKGDMMGLGRHCGYPTCHLLDFLPLQCPGCSQFFCKEHGLPFAHSCPAQTNSTTVLCEACQQVVVIPIGVASQDRIAQHQAQGCQSIGGKHYKCGAIGCQTADYLYMPCSSCKRHMCVRHRMCQDHACTSLSQPIEREVTSRVAPPPRPSTKVTKPISTKAGQTALKVQLMKLKLHAKPLASVTLGQRHYLRIVLSLGHHPDSLLIYAPQSWSAGRLLDAVAEAARIANQNNQLTVQ